jgi:dihydroorotase/N-acyl-D-amino-acid deacylase
MRQTLILTAATAIALTVASTQPPPYDLVIRNARVVDGTGSPWFRADVAIAGDTIAAIAPAIDRSAARVIDAQGHVVAPGFIDIHTHARRGIEETPTAANYVRQGVTTVIEGPDGSSPLPVGPFLAQLSSLKISVNIATFVGQGTIRNAVVGAVNRLASPDEIEKMKTLVEGAMTDGAFGLSTGLFYVPGTFTPTGEVVELAKVAGRFGGMHASHQRTEAAGVLDSVRETIAIGEQGGLPTQISHAKVIGTPNFGKSAAMLSMVDAARARGVDVTLDQYPYTASSTSIASALMPAWLLEGGRQATLGRLKDSGSREKAKGQIAVIIRDERGGGDLKNVQFASCGFDPSLNGKTLADLTAQRNVAPTIRSAAEAVMWIVERGGCQGIFHAMSEADLLRILKHPATMIASDGEIPAFGRASPHPRSYGTFARVLGRYVREQKALTLEDAVRKMSAFPAARLGLADRGVIRAGLKADLAIFDPATVADTATFTNPHQYARGFSFVVVNGQVAYENGEMTAARPGRVLYGPGRPAASR